MKAVARSTFVAAVKVWVLLPVMLAMIGGSALAWQMSPCVATAINFSDPDTPNRGWGSMMMTWFVVYPWDIVISCGPGAFSNCKGCIRTTLSSSQFLNGPWTEVSGSPTFTEVSATGCNVVGEHHTIYTSAGNLVPSLYYRIQTAVKAWSASSDCSTNSGYSSIIDVSYSSP